MFLLLFRCFEFLGVSGPVDLLPLTIEWQALTDTHGRLGREPSGFLCFCVFSCQPLLHNTILHPGHASPRGSCSGCSDVEHDNISDGATEVGEIWAAEKLW